MLLFISETHSYLLILKLNFRVAKEESQEAHGLVTYIDGSLDIYLCNQLATSNFTTSNQATHSHYNQIARRLLDCQQQLAIEQLVASSQLLVATSYQQSSSSLALQQLDRCQIASSNQQSSSSLSLQQLDRCYIASSNQQSSTWSVDKLLECSRNLPHFSFERLIQNTHCRKSDQ